MYLINMDCWQAERLIPGNVFSHADASTARTFKEVYFTFLELPDALKLLKEQEQLYIKHRGTNIVYTWSVTGVTELPYAETMRRTYATWVEDTRNGFSNLQAMEININFNVDWIKRNLES